VPIVLLKIIENDNSSTTKQEKSNISMGEIPVIPVHGEQYSLGHNQY